MNLIPLPYKIAIAAGLLVALWAGYALWRHSIYEEGVTAGKAEQTILSEKLCDADKKITQGVSDEYQKKLSSLNRQLTALRLRPSKFVAIIPDSASGHDAAASAGQLRGQNGMPSGVLYEYAGDAERTRLQLISCQEFINKWQARSSH